MTGWRRPVLVVLAAAALAGCSDEPVRTTVTPPRVTLPENAPLHGSAPTAAPQTAAPATAAVPAAQDAPPVAAAPPTSVSGAGPAPLPQVKNVGDAEGARLLAQRALLVPVAGIAPASLSDHYELARGQRVHEAIDIMAPTGTPVVAVDDGRIEKLFNSRAGGLTIYQYDREAKLTYYYAHLDRYAPGVREGLEVKRGDVIGYVGSTGNANPAAPHLHFAVFRLPQPPKWWEGEAVNPYPALSRAAPAAPQVASR
ncbi:M23 family metallopeptidase [Ramlibacter pallidus]|uniref:M23 family metallopeptidase n=1 Tax=Ramlibacter pallidus TaxID=2780087 RepID=UPI00338D350E